MPERVRINGKRSRQQSDHNQCSDCATPATTPGAPLAKRARGTSRGSSRSTRPCDTVGSSTVSRVQRSISPPTYATPLAKQAHARAGDRRCIDGHSPPSAARHDGTSKKRGRDLISHEDSCAADASQEPQPRKRRQTLMARMLKEGLIPWQDVPAAEKLADNTVHSEDSDSENILEASTEIDIDKVLSVGELIGKGLIPQEALPVIPDVHEERGKKRVREADVFQCDSAGTRTSPSTDLLELLLPSKKQQIRQDPKLPNSIAVDPLERAFGDTFVAQMVNNYVFPLLHKLGIENRPAEDGVTWESRHRAKSGHAATVYKKIVQLYEDRYIPEMKQDLMLFYDGLYNGGKQYPLHDQESDSEAKISDAFKAIEVFPDFASYIQKHFGMPTRGVSLQSRLTSEPRDPRRVLFEQHTGKFGPEDRFLVLSIELVGQPLLLEGRRVVRHYLIGLADSRMKMAYEVPQELHKYMQRGGKEQMQDRKDYYSPYLSWAVA